MLKNEVHGEEVVRPDEARGEKTRPVGEDLGEGGRHTNIRWGGGWRGVTSLAKSPSIVVNPPLPSGRTHSACGDEMLRVVAPYVAEMLHLKSLSINRVAGVAGFQTMSTCKPHLNSLAINVLVSFFNGFLCLSSGHTLNFGAVPHLSRLKNRHQATGSRTQPAGADQCARHLQVAPLRRLLPDAPSPAGAGELPGRGSASRLVAPERSSKMVHCSKNHKKHYYHVDGQ